jgi:hypothetical protein
LGSETVRFSGTATARRSRILKIGRSTVALLDGRLEVLDLIHDDIEFTSYCLGREAEGGFYRARADILDWRGPAEVKRRVLLRADLKPARIGFVWLSLVPSPKGVIAMFECDQLERSGLPNIVLDTSFVRDGGQVERRWLGAADVETGQVRMLASLDVPVLPIGPQYLPSRWRLAYVDSWEAVAVVTDIGVSLVSAR